MKIYLLLGWRKPGEDGDVALAASLDRREVVAAAQELNARSGYVPGNGLWDSDKTLGCFHCKEVEVSSGDDFMAAATKAGMAFVRHEDKR